MTYAISVIIPTYQGRALVVRALWALADQTLPRDQYEVIVVIDGSDDGTQEMIAQLAVPYHLQVIWRPNGGRAVARNTGIGLATGHLLVFLDDDMQATPGLLAAHRAAHPSDTPVAVLGPVPITIDHTTGPAASYVATKFNAHLHNLARNDHVWSLRDFYSGNFSIRRDILVHVGGFDAQFRRYGNEDVELALRLCQAGVGLVYCPAAQAQQQYTKDFRALAHDNLSKGATAVQLAAKHPDMLTETKLGTYGQGGLLWRGLRAVLLALGTHWQGLTEWLIRCTVWLERRHSPGLHRWYRLVLDYCFWLGVGRERAEPPRRQGRQEVKKLG